MTDALWGEIRSLLHANTIERSKAREIALALAEGLTDERAEQLLMLVDGLTHKRGDVIIDGEWVELPEGLEDMTLAELKAAYARIEPAALRMAKRCGAIIYQHNRVVERAQAAAQALADLASVAHDPDLSKQVMPTILSNFVTRLSAAQRDPAFSSAEIINATWGEAHDDT
jgi:hypothetical protein